MDLARTGPDPQQPLCLLSLDGGGISGISELFILQEIMHRVRTEKQLDYEPLPADYFDLIGGTSTGGLIAILLGRLGFSVSEAITVYGSLAKKVFSEKKAKGRNGTYKASNLEKVIKEVLEEKLGAGHVGEKMWELYGDKDRICKTFVCAVASQHINGPPRLFRTWAADKNPGYNCTIWEACRATTAASTFFKPILIGDPGLQESFVDAGLGCNNPIKQLIEEAKREFGGRDIGCIVSIGTGVPGITAIGASRLGIRNVPSLLKALKSIITDTERESRDMKERFKNCPGLYSRLNVERGLEGVSLAEWEKMGDVKTHTVAYLEGNYEISQEVDRVVETLTRQSLQRYGLDLRGGFAPNIRVTPTYFCYPATSRSPHFTPRSDPFNIIKDRSRPSKKSQKPEVVVLHGMGGCGKSQLALEFCYQADVNGWFSAIFWIDASTPTTAAQSYATIAQRGFDITTEDTHPSKSVAIVKAQMKKLDVSWFLVLDNFDEPSAFRQHPIEDFYLDCPYGFVLFTSRDASSKRLGHGLALSDMLAEEALKLLLASSGSSKDETLVKDGHEIVHKLGCLALAVDQAGAYIQARSISFAAFLGHFDRRREFILKETPEIWSYRRKLSETEAEQALSVATTWELSLEQISGNERQRESKRRFLTLTAFLSNQCISEAIFRENVESESASWRAVFVGDDGRWDHDLFLDAAADLRKLHLIQTLESNADHSSFSLHPLIQDWIKLRLTKDDQASYTKEAIYLLQHFLDAQDQNAWPLQLKQETLLHLYSVNENKKSYLNQDMQSRESLVRAEWSFASFLHRRGQYADAEVLFKQTLSWYKDNLNEEHPDTFNSMHNLAVTYLKQEQWKEAEELGMQVMKGGIKMLGKEHPNTLDSMHNLALIYSKQERWKEAEELEMQVIEISKRVSGHKHPSTITYMSLLAFIQNAQGRKLEAINLMEEEVHRSRELLGPTHPKTEWSTTRLKNWRQEYLPR